ncbi:MAG: glycoside hydrolase [Muribaculaceae bacterium]|nr:glycoside hydrolase [Muribaculaceae bacterium]
MLRYISLLLLTLVSYPIFADVKWQGDRQRWLSIADSLKPTLMKDTIRPRNVVKAINDNGAYQGWRYDSIGNPKELLYNKSFKDVNEITLDFGKHMTGYLSFRPKTLYRCQDAPVRIKLFMAEFPSELNTPLDPWKGSLSRAWMQDEIVTITDMDEYITIPRRQAGRYLKLELLGASPDFDFGIDDIIFIAVTSADKNNVEELENVSPVMQKINTTAIETLKECMQTVFEDGPKRDHRLWSGDLYLQSLVNRHTFKNFDLVKRCIYLFAGLADDDGIILSNIFEDPVPHPQYGSLCLPYSLLWNSTLLEYLKDTQDYETGEDLWKVAKKQMEVGLDFVDERYLFNPMAKPGYWFFIDWRDGLDLTTPMQGAVIFALDQSYELAKLLGKEKEVTDWPKIADKMRKASREELYDKKNGYFVSGPENQVSMLSQAWMIKSDVVKDKEAKKALETACKVENVFMPGTPYGTHYVVDAMLKSGMNKEAYDYIEDYWGGMVKKGADTFWESYDPDNDYISAYNFHPLNSSCHAWSCTPVLFFHQNPEVFKK